MSKEINAKQLVELWFKKWTDGEFMNLPIADNFSHTSPFGTIVGKSAYLDLVQANKDKFLGYEFVIHDVIAEHDRACVRYTAVQGEFSLDVSEWHYCKNGLITSVVAYYHIGDVRDDRQLE